MSSNSRILPYELKLMLNILQQWLKAGFHAEVSELLRFLTSFWVQENRCSLIHEVVSVMTALKHILKTQT